MWKIFNENSNLKFESDQLIDLSYFNHSSYSQMYPNNWINFTIVYTKNQKIISFARIIVIKKYFFKLIHIPGGIEGKFDSEVISDLYNFIKIQYDYFSIIFINFHQKNSLNNLIHRKFSKIINLHETRMVMKKSLTDKDLLYKSYSKNWRHNLNRSKKFSNLIFINQSPNIKELMDLYNEMSKLKNFKIFITKVYLERIFKYLNKKIIHLECRIDGKLIAFRTCFYHKDIAWDLLACSNKLSKKNYSTYTIMHKMFSILIEKNIRIFDFSGVDKKNNLGVYNFKKGAGSVEYNKIGEYTYSKNLILKYIFVLFIFLKRLLVK